MERNSLKEAWNMADSKERAEMVATLCKSHPTLICQILVNFQKCKVIRKEGCWNNDATS